MLNDKTREYLLIGLRESPGVIEWILRNATPSDYDRRPDPDRFTIREIVAHLSDWEAIWLERMKLIQSEDHPTLKVYDETERAIEQDYAHSNVETQQEIFRKRRAATVTFLTSLSLEKWDRAAQHPEWGEQSIESMAVHILGHDMYHIKQIADWLVIGES